MGWLDKFEEGGFLGTTNRGRDYSPAWGGQFQNGGWLSKYENGGEISYYQQGRDFQPKMISENGSSVPKAQGGKTIKITDSDGKERMIDIAEYTKLYNSGKLMSKNNRSDVYSAVPLREVEIVGQKTPTRRWIDDYTQTISNETDGPISMLMSPINAAMSFPQLATVSAFTGKPERPSTALEIENPIGAMATDMVLDPLNLIGGEFVKNPLDKNSWKNGKRLFKDIFDKDVYNKIDKEERSIKRINLGIVNTAEDLDYDITKLRRKIQNSIDIGSEQESDKIINQLHKSNRQNRGREIVKSKFRKEGKNIIATEESKLSGATTTGTKPITHFRTNSSIDASVSVPEKTKEYSLSNGEVNELAKETSTPSISEEYKNVTADNIKYIEELVPGAKVYGSSRGVVEGDLPHLTGDYDVLISRKNYDKHVTPNFEFIDNKGPAKQHSIGKEFGEQGVIDFNIIEETPSGNATGERANELYKQFHPDEYYESARRAFINNSEIEIPYTPDELLESSNPATKTIVDAYESTKPKHINKIDSYISYGNPDKVVEAQDVYIKSLVGKRGTIGHQFSPEELSDVEKNVEILKKIDFIGDYQTVANNPKRMQAAINDYYINNTTLSRGSEAGYHEKNLQLAESSFKEWKPELGGGQVMGSGQNHVILGESGYDGFYSNKQLGISHDTSDPLKYIDDIERQLNGEYPYSEAERAKVNEILLKNGITQEVNIPGELINVTAGHDNAKQILSEVADVTGRKAVIYGTYGDSKYASTLKDVDDAIDAVQWAAKPHVTVGKSYLTRKGALNSSDDSRLLGQITKQKFQKISNLLDDGLAKAEERKNRMNKRLQELAKNTDEKLDKAVDKTKRGQEIKAEQARLLKEYNENKYLIEQLHRRYQKVLFIRNQIKTVGLIAPTTGVTLGAAYRTFMSNDDSELKYRINARREELRERGKVAKKKKDEQERRFQAKTEKRETGGVVKDNLGYWNPDNIGKVVEIGSSDITMRGVSQPLLGISDSGDRQLMLPGRDYKFKGKKVREYPVAKYGINELDNLTNFTNNSSTKNWLNKYN